MALLRKLTFNNSVFAKILLVIIISILICFIGYMFGKFAWYLTH
jgi:hypothetical protein